MTTINDIARLANVSRSTVSRCLNDNGYVSEDARKRIMEVIEETGYMPSQSAKSLRTKKTGVIGVILPKISTETASRVVSGINDVLQANQYQILLTDTSLQKTKEIEFIRLLQSRNVDGIILLGTNKDQELIQAIDQAQVPVVVLGQEIPVTTSVVYPDAQATSHMIEFMLEKGYKKIGFIGAPETDPAVGITRKKAYKETLAKHAISYRDEWVQTGDFAIESGYEKMKQIMEESKDQRPDSVFVVTDNMAVGAIQYIKEQNMQIPKDIAVAATGASTLSQYIEPSLTTIDFLNEEAGATTAQCLLDAIDGKKARKKMEHTYRLLIRNSV
ncbi:LacI family DNA-binding transcriptional regulator [Gracilibacillus sp. YIM 98692]|uniref:LacI family DNA-binding transcriptional regulator n=1 Tax=Gracilibacillus sp. YIM 98692 TaxID=2663532 RepID=UPI0013D0DC41|nr:LacI family DNA-binding transcriptional regulator [Gracilibacillus sp. YIM 98692]